MNSYEKINEAYKNSILEVKKIACLECDKVSTATAWKKNYGTCPKCKVSTKGVAEGKTMEDCLPALADAIKKQWQSQEEV